MRDLIGLVHRVIDVAQADQPWDAQLVEGLRAEVAGLADLADHPRETSRTIRDVADHPREAVSPDRREGGSGFEESPGKPLPPSLSEVRDIRETPASRTVADVVDVADPPDSGGATRRRSDADLDELVGPLTRLAERTNLVGVTNLEALRSALAPFDDDQVRYAVTSTVALVRAGTITKSPIGWLFSKARTRDVNFFPPPGSSCRSQSRPPSTSAAEEPVDLQAEARVSALENDDAGAVELEVLDRVIRRGSRAGPTVERIFANPTALHAARVIAWRADHPTPPPSRRPTNVHRPTPRPDPAPIDLDWPRPAS